MGNCALESKHTDQACPKTLWQRLCDVSYPGSMFLPSHLMFALQIKILYFPSQILIWPVQKLWCFLFRDWCFSHRNGCLLFKYKFWISPARFSRQVCFKTIFLSQWNLGERGLPTRLTGNGTIWYEYKPLFPHSTLSEGSALGGTLRWRWYWGVQWSRIGG